MHILVNDLNLRVEVGSPCSTRYLGNFTTVLDNARGEESVVASNSCLATASDTTNNVEWIKFFPSVNGATQFTVKVAMTQGTNQTFALVVYNGYEAAGPEPPAKPLSVVATGNATPSVAITWGTVSTATSYEVRRRSAASPFATLVGQPSSAAFTDNSVSAGSAYAYSIRARNSTGVSNDSAWDFATTMGFTDDPIVPGVTSVRQVHITQLQSAVNAVRAAIVLPPFSFTPFDPAGLIKAVDILDLRSALAAARTAVSLPAASYTDPTLTSGATVIKAAHVTELRSGVQ